MKKSLELKIDLNCKDKCGNTCFHDACDFGCFKIVDMMIDHSESLELDLKAKNSDGKTGYQLAKPRGATYLSPVHLNLDLGSLHLMKHL